MPTFKELLGTDNKKEQEARIVKLLQIEATPEITLQIRYNGIYDTIEIHLSGGDVPFDIVHRMLELTSKAMRREELSQLIEAQAQDNGTEPEK